MIANNIIVNSLFHAINVGTGSQYAQIDNNLAYQASGSAAYKMTNSDYVTSTFNALTKVSGTIEADPLFASVGTGPTDRDLSILTASPAKDAGIAASGLVSDIFAEYQTIFGVGIMVDYNGGSRPARTTWDIGAYEFGAPIPDITAPVFTVDPSITGTAEEGQTLTGNRGTITGVPSPGYAYQWLRCDAAGDNAVDISGATSLTYTAVIADVGSTLRLKVTATNSEGSAVATSAQTGVVAGVTVARPTFSPTNHVTFPAP